MVSALSKRGMQAPFAIQTRALPDALAGRDVLGRAQTGSGKTLAFGLPVLSRLAVGGGSAERRSEPGRPRGLVLVPTRELAQQVTEALGPLASALGLSIGAVYGGASMNAQVSMLRRRVDIVVATPGRLLDLIGQRECSLTAVEISVLDEADFMADLGFLPDVTRLMDMTPESGQRMLFSATLDRNVAKLVHGYLNDPAVHAVAPAAAPVESVTHQVFTVRNEQKAEVAAEIAGRPARTLFFVRTKRGADRLSKQLRRNGVEAEAIHGDRGQSARRRALDGFSDGAPRVLVATDVAARGLHVDDLDLVVHYDPPKDHKDYLHRSGRTARAGASGVVICLALEDQTGELGRLHRDAKVSPTVHTVAPGDPVLREVASSGTPVVPRPRREGPVAQGTGSGRPRARRSRRTAGSSSGNSRQRSR